MDKKDLLILEMLRLLGNAEGNLEGLKFSVQDADTRKRLIACKNALTSGVDKVVIDFKRIKADEIKQIRSDMQRKLDNLEMEKEL